MVERAACWAAAAGSAVQPSAVGAEVPLAPDLPAAVEFPDPEHPVHRACAAHLAEIRRYIAELARGDGIADPEAFARDWHLLMKGSIVAAAEGDVDAARRARRIGEQLLAGAAVVGD